jgi:hypothetical protein
MKDRISNRPGRVLITPEDGSTPFYANIAMADEPTQVGDPPTKANLLTDATASKLGLGENSKVNDALVALYSRNEWKKLADVGVTEEVNGVSIALNDDLRKYKEVVAVGSTMKANKTVYFRGYIGSDANGTQFTTVQVYSNTDYKAYFGGRTSIVMTDDGAVFLGDVSPTYNGGKPVTTTANRIYLLAYGSGSSVFAIGTKLIVFAR